jgi:hypothetical protein
MTLDELEAVLNPPDRQDDFTALMRTEDLGFRGAKRLADGTYVGVLQLAFTVAICIGVDRYTSFKRRYCFSDLSQCLAEFENITTKDCEPEGWIARRPVVASDYEYKP